MRLVGFSFFITIFKIHMKNNLLSFLLVFIASFGAAQNFNIVERAHMTFPGQTLANICGYAADGHEYALLGGSQGMIVVDVTNPDNPVQIVQVPGVNNLWKEIKVYQHYAYVTTEGVGGALQIVDLSNLPNTNLAYHTYTGDGAIAGQLSKIHALHIDVTKGFVYLYGHNIGNKGALVLDLNQDPYNPHYVGQYNLQYIHDGYVDNDTLWACQIYQGNVTVINFADKANPVVLQTQQTPGNFTHNSWLTLDHKTLLTTDEVSNSFLTAYDVSDLNNIHELDRIQTTPGSNSIVHNTHIRDDYAVTSWYRDGVAIVDAHRPQNLVMVGAYDTYDGSGSGFDGAWGVYPFLPSGTLVVSNIDEGLYVLTPTYVRACYLEGHVTNASTGADLNNVSVSIVGNSASNNAVTDISGQYKTGQPQSGNVMATFSKQGFYSQTLPAVLNNGEVTILDVALEPKIPFSGYTIRTIDGIGIPAQVIFQNDSTTFEATANSTGQFTIDGIDPGNYTVYAGAWGYQTQTVENVTVQAGSTITVTLDKGYEDDFFFDLGWSVNSTSSSGAWVRGEPIGTDFGGNLCNPEVDVEGDLGDQCYITGNNGGSAGDDDVDNGYTTLTSPAMDLSDYEYPVIYYRTWFFNSGGTGNPNDYLQVFLDNGTQQVQLENIVQNDLYLDIWRPESEIKVAEYLPVTNNMHLIFKTEDVTPGHLVEAGVDAFRVEDSTAPVGTTDVHTGLEISAYPNPFSGQLFVKYDLNEPAIQSRLEVCNLLGQIIESHSINTSKGMIQVGKDLGKGVYLVKLENNHQVSQILKVVKE